MLGASVNYIYPNNAGEHFYLVIQYQSDMKYPQICTLMHDRMRGS